MPKSLDRMYKIYAQRRNGYGFEPEPIKERVVKDAAILWARKKVDEEKCGAYQIRQGDQVIADVYRDAGYTVVSMKPFAPVED